MTGAAWSVQYADAICNHEGGQFAAVLFCGVMNIHRAGQSLSEPDDAVALCDGPGRVIDEDADVSAFVHSGKIGDTSLEFDIIKHAGVQVPGK